MDRNELESPLSLPTAKLEQCDSEYMKENFNITETVLLYKTTALFCSASLAQIRIYNDTYAYTSINLFVVISDALFPLIKSLGSSFVSALMHVKSSI